MIKMIKTLIFEITDNISLRSKIQLMFILFFLMPLFIFTQISYTKTNELIRRQTISSMNQSVENGLISIHRYFSSLEESMETILSDSEIYEAIYAIQSSDSAMVQQQQYKTLNAKFNYIKTVSEADSVKLYINSKVNFLKDGRNLFSLDDIRKYDWYKSLDGGNNSRTLLPPNLILDANGETSSYFSLVNIIYNPNSFKEKIALLQVDISKEKVNKALSSLKLVDNVAVLFTKNNDILYSVFDTNLPYTDINFSSEFSSDKGKWIEKNILGKSYFVRFESVPNTDWTFNIIFPAEELFREQNILYIELAFSLLIIVIVSASLSYATIHSVLKRVSSLNVQMKKIESGILVSDFYAQGKDEIGTLMHSFHYMSSRLKDMMDESFRLGEAKKNAELKALQSQINPHFLYNSLDLINCIAIQRNVPEITEMVNSLVEFYRLSLNKGLEYISLYDEVMHASMYIKIQNLRFDREIKLNTNADSSLKNYYMPKITLQPLVENSILHGILEHEDIGEGKIDIHFEDNENYILIFVSDNGVGMSNEALQNILSAKKSPDGGYGIQNINERLTLVFGKDNGLNFMRNRSGGITVKITIPKIISKGFAG